MLMAAIPKLAYTPQRLFVKQIFKTLSAKFFFAIVIWLFGALCSMSLSLYFLWKLEDSGIAINQAGSLRMRATQIVLAAQLGDTQQDINKSTHEFQDILSALEHKLPVQFSNTQETLRQIQRIRTQADLFFQTLNQQKPDKSAPEINEIVHQMNALIFELDTLVKTIENNNTKHIQWLRIFQFGLFILAIFSAFFSLLFLNYLVIKPLNHLKLGIDKIGHGHFTTVIPNISDDEFGTVAMGFNKMSQNIKDLYTNLEEKVQNQTQSLKEKSDELKLLYDVTAFLHSTHDIEKIANTFLENIQTISFAQAVSIRLTTSQGSENIFLTGIDHIEKLNFIEQTFKANASSSAHQSNIISYHIPPATSQEIPFSQSVSFHNTKNKTNNAYLTLYFEHSIPLSERTLLLIEALFSQFTVATENQRLITLDKQFAVLEERNLMAQGLHDSIAQSLSFLNIQTQMLKNALQDNKLKQANKNIQFIQQGIQVSYEDVRELLTNFRTKLDTENFQQSIHSVIQRFKTQTDIPVTLHMDTSGDRLSIEQQLQAIFILQEALSNIRKHANAKHVSINIIKNQQFVMSIQDDGTGFSLKEKLENQTQHIGLNIMQERAKRAHGNVLVQTIPGKGTRVTLKIKPHH